MFGALENSSLYVTRKNYEHRRVQLLLPSFLALDLKRVGTGGGGWRSRWGRGEAGLDFTGKLGSSGLERDAISLHHRKEA